MAAIDILVNYITKGDKQATSALTDLAKAMGVVGAAVGTAKAIYEATVGPTIEYAKQIENLNTVTQTGAAETSKLIQVADDARIEFGTLQVASKNLVKNGIQPTIANLAGLSDEYLSIQDPVQRTQFLMETFGNKAGPEMEKLLKLGSDALYEMADGAEAVGLVMDEQALQAAKDYQASLDNLGDTVEGVKIKIGTAMIPALDDALKGTMAAAGGYMMMAEAIVSTLNPLDDAAKAAEKKAAADALAAQEAANLEAETVATRVATQEASYVLGDEYAQAMIAANDAQLAYVSSNQEARAETEALFASINTNLDNTIAKWLEDLEWMQSGGLELQAQFEAIKKAFVENPDDPRIKQQMEDLYAQTQALNVEIGKIDATAAAENISKTLGISMNEAWEALNNFRLELQKGQRMTVSVEFDDHGGYQGSTPGTQQSGSGQNNLPIAEAYGGAAFAGGDYWVGERGPEPFTPAQPGTITPTQTVINNYNLSMQTAQSTGNLMRDFGVMKSFARA